nr:uncharacterized protein LOC116769238 [Danaus plexippus plexippus]
MPAINTKAMWSRKQSVCSAVSGASKCDDQDASGQHIYPFAIALRVRVLQKMTSAADVTELRLFRPSTIYAELEATGQFEFMDVQTDEDEHSIEMHLPYIAKVMEEFKTAFTIIPILVGSLSPDREAKYGAILAPYLADPQNLVVVSSDFCHWGSSRKVPLTSVAINSGNSGEEGSPLSKEPEQPPDPPT